MVGCGVEITPDVVQSVHKGEQRTGYGVDSQIAQSVETIGRVAMIKHPIDTLSGTDKELVGFVSHHVVVEIHKLKLVDREVQTSVDISGIEQE